MIGDYCLECAQECKHLELTFTNTFSWNTRIDNIVKQASSHLGFLRRSLKVAPPNLKLNAYKTLVRAPLEYGDIIWDPFTEKSLNKLEIIRRKAVRSIYDRYI